MAHQNQTAIIYSRVSTTDQDNARQIEELSQYASGMNYNLLQIFEEKISGRKKGKDRPEFQKLLEFIQENRVDHLLVWELSRLGRNMIDVQNTIEELSGKKINIYIYKDRMNTLDANGNKSVITSMIISLIAGLAEMEADNIKSRSKSGLRQRASIGGAGGGIVKAYGYKNENKMLVVDEEEAEVVRIIFQKYLEGLGTKAIATFLTKTKVPTKFNKVHKGKVLKTRFGYEKKAEQYKWNDGTIYSILNNSIYYGDRKYKGEVFKVAPIITKEIFDLCQAKLKSNFKKPSSEKKYDNILAGLLICPRCGKNYFMHKRADGSDNAYKCISIRYGERCGNPSINIDKLNAALFMILKPVIFNTSILSNTNDIKLNIENKQIELDAITNSITIEKSKMDKLVTLHLEDNITKSQFNSRKLQLESDIKKLQEKQLKINSELASIKKLSESRKGNQYTFEMFKKYLPDAVSSIKIYEVKKQSNFDRLFTAKNDMAVLIEVTTLLGAVIEKKSNKVRPMFKHFVLTRYSGNLGMIKFHKHDIGIDYSKEIDKGNYSLDNVLSLIDDTDKVENEFQVNLDSNKGISVRYKTKL